MKKNKLTRLTRRLKWLFGVYLWPNHVSSIMTWNGLLSFYSKDRTLGRSLHVERSFEKELMLRSVDILKSKGYLSKSNEGVVLDAGGYIGMSSIGFVNNELFSGGIAFEPNPNNFYLLEKNIEQNKLKDSISAFNVALSDTSHIMKMELSTKNYGDHRIRNEDLFKNGYFDEHKRKIIDVNSIPLDQFLNEHKEINAEEIKLVWMDIQGWEGHFLNGAKEFFRNNLTTPVIMEFTPYLLKRAGMDKAKFCSIVDDIFENFYILDENCENKYKIDELAGIYEKYDSPTKGAHLVLVNKTIN